MTTYQVEFLDPDPAREVAATRPTPNRLPRRESVALAALWASSAALCAVASFQTVFSYHFTGTWITSHGGYNAWGHSLDSAVATEHGPRYALLLGLCAVLLATLAVAAARSDPTEAGARWLQRNLGALGLTAAALLAGTVASIALGIEASFATYRALAGTLDTGGVDLSVGGCLWFGLAAVACGVGAVVVPFRQNRRRTGPHAAGPQ
jgi:hypothetical protein